MADLRTVLCLLPLALLCACAGAPTPPPPAGPMAEAPPPPGPDDTAYGLFLAGQAAAARGRSAAAAGYFDDAATFESGAGSRYLTVRAFTESLLAGDIARAAALAPQGADYDPAMRRLGALVRGVDALSRGDGRAARAILAGPDADTTHESATALLLPYAAYAAGDKVGAVTRPVIADEPISQFFADLDQAELYERVKQYGDAETTLRALVGKGDPGSLASMRLGAFLERRGRDADAVEIYDQALRRGGADQALKAMRARAAAHRPAPALAPLRRGEAEALMAPATLMMVHKQEQVSLAYLRMALHLDPTRDEAWLMVGDILSNIGDQDGARAAYAAPRPGSDQYVPARDKLAWSWQNGGDKATALEVARSALAAASDDQDAAVTVADLLRADSQYDQSAKILDGLIAAQGAQVDWRLLYMRAVDYEESDRWAQAQADLEAALKIKPDEPELLNFLGYSWIDRGERLPQALAMVQKAVDLNPGSGAMIDSLGWAYYRLGRYSEAVDKLEAAVVLEPADPDVNDHLGDAYWRVGRKVEAGFQWRRVLSLDPDAKLRARVEAKLEHGPADSQTPAVSMP